MDGLSLTYHLLNCIILFPGGWVPRDTAYARAKARYLPQVEINSVLVVYACGRGNLEGYFFWNNLGVKLFLGKFILFTQFQPFYFFEKFRGLQINIECSLSTIRVAA